MWGGSQAFGRKCVFAVFSKCHVLMSKFEMVLHITGLLFELHRSFTIVHQF